MNEKMNDPVRNKKVIRSFDIDKTVQSFANRLLIANRAEASIRSHTRAINRESAMKTRGIDPYSCSKCKKYMMLVMKIIPSTRGSPPKGFVKSEMMKDWKIWIPFTNSVPATLLSKH